MATTGWVKLGDSFMKQVITESLSTHLDLINFNIIKSIDTLSNSFSLNEPEKLADFLVHICKDLYTGKFSKKFNNHLDKCITSNALNELVKLVDVSEMAKWPEVYDNTLITELERIEIIAIHEAELTTMLNVIEEGHKCKSSCEKHMIISRGYDDQPLYSKYWSFINIYELQIPPNIIKIKNNSGVIYMYSLSDIINGVVSNNKSDYVFLCGSQQNKMKLSISDLNINKEIKMCNY